MVMVLLIAKIPIVAAQDVVWKSSGAMMDSIMTLMVLQTARILPALKVSIAEKEIVWMALTTMAMGWSIALTLIARERKYVDGNIQKNALMALITTQMV